MVTVPLDVSVSATADVNGIARARIGPQVYGHEWHVSRIVTTTNDFINRNELKIYLNGEALGRIIAGTYNANQDFNEDDFTLQTLDTLIAVWEKCAESTICTLQLQGTIKDKRGKNAF